MKLLTKRITTNELFREQLRQLLHARISATSFRSGNVNSVDKEDRVSAVEFLSVPHITKISDLSADEVELVGNILIELTLQSQTHGFDGEESVLDTSTKKCGFTLVVAGNARANRELTPSEIKALRIKIRDCSIH